MEENKAKCNCEINCECKVDKKALAKAVKAKAVLIESNKIVQK